MSGLACTISTTYFEPFAVARAMATLDHLSGGRAAWNIVTSFQEAEARNFGRSTQFAREERYDRADEFLEVATALWIPGAMTHWCAIRSRRCSPILRRCDGSIMMAGGSRYAGR